MNALFVAVACAVLVICQAGTTTKHPHSHHTHDPSHTRDPSHTHPTHEPGEHEGFSFYYDPNTHNFIMTSGVKCYVDTTMTNDQLLNVHTDTGMRDLEVALLHKLSSFTSTTKDMLDAPTVHRCGKHATDFYMM